MEKGAGLRIPIGWALAACAALLVVAALGAAGKLGSGLVWLAVLACPLLHLLGGHRHGPGGGDNGRHHAHAGHHHGSPPEAGEDRSLDGSRR